MKYLRVGFFSLLAGCAAFQQPIGQGRDVVVYSHWVESTLGVVNPNTLASIATLDIVPYVDSSGSYVPISSLTGNPTTEGAADALKLTQASPSIDSGRPFVIRRLKPDKNYRILGRAYNAANTLISLDASSVVNVSLGHDDAPSVASLPIMLTAVPFGAKASVTVNTDGRFDYLKGTLFHASTQVAVVSSVRSNPELVFNNLQGDTNYQLVVEAYKQGALFASSSLPLNIANENAPVSASLSLSVPYVASYFAGNGNTTPFSEGAPGTFSSPYGIAADAAGNLYVADQNNHRVRKVTPAGVVSTLAGNGTPGFVNGVGTAAQLCSPMGIAVDSQGNVYVSENYNHCIRKITSAGVVTTLAGNGTAGYANGNGAAAQFSLPWGVAVDFANNVYVADRNNHRIRKITSTGDVTTLAGNGTAGFAEGAAGVAQFNTPIGMAVDPLGYVYVADEFNGRIRKITPAGVVSTFADVGNTHPVSVALDSYGNVYDAEYPLNRIRRITPAGIITTIAGNGTAGSTNATGVSTLFNAPYAVTVDPSGQLFVVDVGNQRIRKLQ